MKGRKQDKVNATKHGCQRKDKINVKVIWSSKNYNEGTKNKISGATDCFVYKESIKANIPDNFVKIFKLYKKQREQFKAE